MKVASAHDSQVAAEGLWGKPFLPLFWCRVRVASDRVLLGDQGVGAHLSAMQDEGSGDPQRFPQPLLAERADRPPSRLPGHRSSPLSVPPLRAGLRGPPPFARAQARYTRKLEKFVDQLSRLMTLRDVAELTGLGWDTVKEIAKRRLRRDYGRIDLRGVKHLSIDEIYVGKRGYYTLVLDLDSGRILWVSAGRGKAGLQGFWRRLRRSRARIRAVAMDMSGAYCAAVAEALPGVPIVFDKFHIIQLMNQRLDELRRELVREAEGPMKLVIKGTRYLLLTRADNLDPDQIPKLERALKLNEPLSQGWYLKEELILLWEQPSYEAMSRFLSQWCEQANQTGVRQLQKMAKTLQVHRRGILNWWRHPINNGRMEGTNNKIKTLNRQAYGYRDEDFFVLKLLGLHESRYKLSG
ncbi:MAG: ISL3 family transposase [Gammaproteobacteria bacterium]